MGILNWFSRKKKASGVGTPDKPSGAASQDHGPLTDALKTAGYTVRQRPASQEAMVDSIVQAMRARQTSISEGTFETGEKNPQRILCSDNACPCTDAQPLVIGRTAYMYISQAVVDFRKDCRTLLERDMMLERAAKTMGMSALLVDGGVANPFYLCETGAKLRGLDLSAALADAKMVAETGFAPLRTTPRAKQ